MIRTIRTPVILLGAVFAAACSPDAQTESEVTTNMADGSVGTSMSGDAADARGVALVRVVNAVPDMKTVTVRADDMRSLPAVDYKTVTPYTNIDANWARFEVSGGPGGTYAPLETNREVMADGHRYTMIVLREEDDAELKTRIFRDEISNDASKAHLRVIHAARGIDEVTVVAQGGETIFDGINYSNEGGFEDIDPWTGTLEFRTEDGNRRIATLPNVNLRAGTSYTVVLTRKDAKTVEAFWFSDTPTP